MGLIPDIFPDDTSLCLAVLTLLPGRHYQRTSRGILLCKSGHDQIRQHVLQSADRGGEVGVIMESVLLNVNFSEETFEFASRPGSIFRSLSQKCLKLVPESYKHMLRSHLHHENILISKRAAKFLLLIYETAESYPDLDTFLHCFFRVDCLSSDKFVKFVRKRLMAIESEAAFEMEFDIFRSGLERFGAEFRSLLGKIGTRRTAGEYEFSEAMETFHIKLDRLRSRMDCLRNIDTTIGRPEGLRPI